VKSAPQHNHPGPASPLLDQSIEIFRARCEARARLYEVGQLNLIEAVDALQAFAVRLELVTSIGQDAVQAIMAAAFEPVRSDLVPKPEVVSKPSQPTEEDAEAPPRLELADIPLVATHGLPSAAVLQREYELTLERQCKRYGPAQSVLDTASWLAYHNPERLQTWLLKRPEWERNAVVAYLRGKQQ
jgi:hypothetical protein